jgi:hypothetical protein
MKRYQYQILRYTPDSISGEFVNVGLVLFQPEENFLKGQVVDSISRLSSFFPETDGRGLGKTLRFIEDEIECIATKLDSELHLDDYSNIENITCSILPKDDSSLQFTKIKEGLGIELEPVFEDLFERLVTKHLRKNDKDEVTTDDEVWRKVYKNYFDKNGITKYLKPHTVKTENDQLDFNFAWKNGAWNCFQTVSFNLKKEDAIKRKVYRWDGMLRELSTTKEKLDLYLLSFLPKHYSNSVEEFIKSKLDVRKVGQTKIRLVMEDEIDAFVDQVKRDISSNYQEEVE